LGRNKKWDGYTSWSYITQDVDYAVYLLEKQVNRVTPYDFGLSKAQEERVEGIIEENIVISLHEHLNVFAAGPLPPGGAPSLATRASPTWEWTPFSKTASVAPSIRSSASWGYGCVTTPIRTLLYRR